MTDDNLSAALTEIRDREQAATKGPWRKTLAPNGGPMVETTWLVPEGYVGSGMTVRVTNHMLGTAGKHEEEAANAEFIAHAREDVPRLLAALDEVLKLHRPRQLYGMVESFSGGRLCAHGPDYDGDAHFEGDDGVWYCRDHPTVMVCDSCADPAYGDMYAEWPCATYAAITRALTGEDEAVTASEPAKAEPFKRPEGCICTMFGDTGGFRIADLTCHVHGVGGTDPGDGNWETDGD